MTLSPNKLSSVWGKRVETELTEGAVPTPALRWSGWRASVPPRHGGGLSLGGLPASQPIIPSSSVELGSQIIPKESNVGSGLGAPCYTAGRAVGSWHGREHGGSSKGESKHPECRLSLLALSTCEGLFPFQRRTFTPRYTSV